ncbi:MAG: SDR family oxidoreductase [Gemmatimonadota bacterium]
MLVTGAAQRLGRDISLALGAAGARLVLHYRNSEPGAESVRSELMALGTEAATVSADFGNPDGLTAFFDQVWAEHGPVAHVVNNASIFPDATLDSLTLSGLEENIRINTWAPFVLTRCLARRLAESGRRGSVVNLLDSRIAGGDPRHASYHLSKVLLSVLTRMAAREFAPAVRVNGVAPGAILPPAGEGEEYLRGLAERLPLESGGRPADVAAAVHYLVCSEAVTGQILFVDGGRHLQPEGA